MVCMDVASEPFGDSLRTSAEVLVGATEAAQVACGSVRLSPIDSKGKELSSVVVDATVEAEAALESTIQSGSWTYFPKREKSGGKT
jgi:hypothetical protein